MSNNEWHASPLDGNGPSDTPPIDRNSDATMVVPRMGEAPAAPYSSQPPPPSPHQQIPASPAQPPPPGAYGQAPPYGQPPAYGQAPGYGPGYGTPQFATPGTTERYRAPGGSITMIIGALLAIIGTFLPWITNSGGGFSDSINGYETYFVGDAIDATLWENPGAYVVGAMMLVIAMAVIILAAGRSTATWILGIIAAGLAGLMTIGALGAVASMLDLAVFGGLSIGIGILVCLLGAVVAGVGAIIVAAKKS